ncbi:hypothetical protein U5801_14340 [Lamprobacter modestohalophilus]|uniref:hypothetical protein n=1 Tax=Lamprobacter modestohalophilus TaxID=1064514 RepID=UPI002ADEDA75|nr:hypothetical protein [Lamprobacter modestohalophilus]MEA1050979.1 hypothetical protein [Lamprobacter modestohalophilus]
MTRLPLSTAILVFFLALFFISSGLDAAVDYVYPVGDKYKLVFKGGIRLEAGTFGSSRVAYTVGAITVDEASQTIWIAGHAHHFSVGAFELPQPVQSFDIGVLPIAPNSQPFVKIEPPVMLEGDPGRVTGMQVIDDRLHINVTEYYDANCNNKNTTVVFDDALNIGRSEQAGYFQMAGRRHAAGWMQPLSDAWEANLGGPYLTGYASNIPINSCLSIGPSLFIWEPASVSTLDYGGLIETTPLIDYSLRLPLSEDPYNESGINTLWTELSKAYLGFVPQGSSDYLVIGTSGGHFSGIGYKITQDNGNRCGGPCAREHDDYYNYFWRYDLNDVAAARSDSRLPGELRPVDYGLMPVFDGQNRGSPLIIGAAYVPESSNLYLLFGSVDTTQSHFERQPLLLVYSVERQSKPPIDPTMVLSRPTWWWSVIAQ